MNSISILGCGWLGFDLAKQLVNIGYLVKGSTTSVSKINELDDAGILPFLVDLKQEQKAKELDLFLSTDLLYVNIPPSKASSNSKSYVESFYPILEALKKSTVKKVVFISATSVYEDSNEEINEESKLASSDRAKRLLDAEQLFLGIKSIDVTIIRFGGLCGNGRNPVTFLSGKNNLTGGNLRINMIHLDDCIRMSINAIVSDNKGIYNAVAEKHPSKKLFYNAMAKRYEVVPPKFEEEIQEIAGKWISVDKFKKDFSYQFIHPDPLYFPK